MEFGPPKAEYVIARLQQAQAEHRLEKFGNFWIGPDVSLAERTRISPLNTRLNVPIMVSRADLPPIEINKGAIGALQWSTRSFLAQSGIEVIFRKGSLTDEMVQGIREGKSVPIPVDIANHIDRPVELEGTIMRFFWVNERNRLRGEELREAIGRDLFIEGVPGKDWRFGDSQIREEIPFRPGEYYALDNKDRCIVLPITPRFQIPPSAEPLRMKSKKDLPDVLQEIPEGGDSRGFRVGETAKIKVGDNAVAVIWTRGYDSGGLHTYSPLIDPGYEGSIRTESLFDLKEIDLYLYRK